MLRYARESRMNRVPAFYTHRLRDFTFVLPIIVAPCPALFVQSRRCWLPVGSQAAIPVIRNPYEALNLLIVLVK
jgi:hypothetical protein